MELSLPGLIGLAVLLLLDAFFAASQTALVNARRHLLRDRRPDTYVALTKK